MSLGPDTNQAIREVALYNSTWWKLCRFLGWKKASQYTIIRFSLLNIHTLPPLPSTVRQVQASFCYLERISDLPEGLEYLYCFWNTSLQALPPLPSTLKGLYVGGCNLRSLPSLPEGLESLICNRNPLQTLPPLPSTLRRLDVDDCNLRSLPSLPEGLEYLSCSWNPLKSLPELPPNLLALCCKNTQMLVLPELPKKMRSYGLIQFIGTPLILEQKKGESLEEYNLRWRKWREVNETKLRTLERTKLLKEDIIAAGWHPRRFEAWCLDEEEKKETEEMCA